MGLPGLIVVLGAPNDAAGNLSDMAVGRLQLGLERHQRLRGEGWRLLLTGGVGAHFNTTDKPHAHYGRNWLVERGVAPAEIVEFAESANTIEDARLSRRIVERHAAERLLVVTSDFHQDRARFVFEQVFPGRSLEVEGARYLPDRPEAERQALVAHEQRALARLRADGLPPEIDL